MALPMPRPFRHKSGIYYLNVRLPTEAVPKLKGAKVLVPVGEVTVEAKLTDKAFVSLRTKEPSTAKTRFGAALEKAGLIQRQLGTPRSIEIIIDPSTVPKLRPSQNQIVKSSVTRY